MQILRTPDERFVNLPAYAFDPHYIEVGDVRIHYVDEGPSEAEPVLMLHGEPSWSYLYRKMIPIIAAAGYRAIAPDLVGFGRSDKPAQRTDYTYQRHVDWIAAFVRTLDLDKVTLFGQDWGGLIGLRVLTGDSDRFAHSGARGVADRRLVRRRRVDPDADEHDHVRGGLEQAVGDCIEHPLSDAELTRAPGDRLVALVGRRARSQDPARAPQPRIVRALHAAHNVPQRSMLLIQPETYRTWTR